MGSLLRFSLRDLLWRTLVVALGLGWFVHERRLHARIIEAQLGYEAQLQWEKRWRGRTGALEHALEKIGWEVQWEFERSLVTVVKRSEDGYRGFPIYTDAFEPSENDD